MLEGGRMAVRSSDGIWHDVTGVVKDVQFTPDPQPVEIIPSGPWHFEFKVREQPYRPNRAERRARARERRTKHE